MVRPSRRRRLLALLPACALLVGAATLSAEDLDPAKLFDSAKQHHAEKRYGRCLADLQLLVGEIGRLRVDVIKGLFPTLPGGFSAEEPEGTVAGGLAVLGAGTQVKRTYRRDESSLEATIWADAGIALQGLQMLLQNPALLGDGRQMVTVKGRKALLEYDKDAKRGTLTVVLAAASGLVTLSGAEFGKDELVDTLGGAFDFDRIEKALAD